MAARLVVVDSDTLDTPWITPSPPATSALARRADTPPTPTKMASFTLTASSAIATPRARFAAGGDASRAELRARARAPARSSSPRDRASAVVALAATTKTPKRVVIAGAPASGKGTQCELIVEKFGLVHISAGDLLRAAVAEGTPAGLEAKAYMDRGDLVPDEVVVTMVKDALDCEEAEENGWLLDGYPRSASQADAIEKEGITPDVFLLLNVPDEMLIERVVGRRLDPETGAIYHVKFFPPPEDVVDRLTIRSDDTEEKAKNRLAVHHSNVEAVVGRYEGKIREIDGDRAKTEVFAEIASILDEM